MSTRPTGGDFSVMSIPSSMHLRPSSRAIDFLMLVFHSMGGLKRSFRGNFNLIALIKPEKYERQVPGFKRSPLSSRAFVIKKVAKRWSRGRSQAASSEISSLRMLSLASFRFISLECVEPGYGSGSSGYC